MEYVEKAQQKTADGETSVSVMARIWRICAHPQWRESVRRIAGLEQTRKFCRHDTAHFLDVARLAWIENLERGLGISKEWIYAAGLLHDIGRGLEYEKGIPHDEGSVMVAEEILRDCGFTDEEQKEILDAIASHRTAKTRTLDNLAGLIYRADKASRMCLFCEAEAECNWGAEKKNRVLKG